MELSGVNKTGRQIRVVDGSRGIFTMRYSLRCSFSFYLSLIKNERQLGSLSSVVAEVRVLEAFRPNLTRNTIKFKRLGSFEPRDCCYVKYSNSSKRQHWEVYLNDQQTQSTTTFKTCELFCVKNLREVNGKELAVSEYF